MNTTIQPDASTLRAGDVHFFAHEELFGGAPQKFLWRARSQSWSRKGWNTGADGLRAQGWTYVGDLAHMKARQAAWVIEHARLVREHMAIARGEK